MNKKAISGVVVTVLLLLISVIAVSVLWISVQSGIETSVNKVADETKCMVLSLKIDSVKIITDPLTESTDVLITIKRNSGKADLTDIKVMFDGKTISSEEVVSSDDRVVPEEAESITYSIISEELPEKIEIAGVLGKDSICGVSDSKSSSDFIVE